MHPARSALGTRAQPILLRRLRSLYYIALSDNPQPKGQSRRQIHMMQHRGSHGMSRSPPPTPAPLVPSSVSRSPGCGLQATVHAAQPDRGERAARTPLLMLALRIDAVHVCRRIPMQSAHSRSTAGRSIHSPPETAGAAFLVRQICTPPPNPYSAPRAYRVREVSTPW